MTDDGKRVFDIFAGKQESEPLWLCSVTGLEEAVLHMRAAAQKAPGHYFVFSSHLNQVMVTVAPGEEAS